MKDVRKAMQLYAVTDAGQLFNRTLAQAVEETLKAGTTFLQLREKDMPYDAFLAEAKELAEIARRYNVPFVINDDVEIAIACNADGVHIGQSDIKGRNVREMIGEDKILGITANTVEDAIAAEKSGADYIGAGAVFPTSTKTDVGVLSYEALCEICATVSIPVVAIGGINADNMQELSGSGIAGVAIVSAIFSSEDVAASTARLLGLSGEMLELENM